MTRTAAVPTPGTLPRQPTEVDGCATFTTRSRHDFVHGEKASQTWSQRDHDLAVNVAAGLQRHCVANLFDREGRGDGHGDRTGKDRVGDLFQGARCRVIAAGVARTPLEGLRPAAIAEIRSGGTPALVASVAAQLGSLAWNVAYERWNEKTNTTEFGELARQTRSELHAASALC